MKKQIDKLALMDAVGATVKGLTDSMIASGRVPLASMMSNLLSIVITRRGAIDREGPDSLNTDLQLVGICRAVSDPKVENIVSFEYLKLIANRDLSS